MNATFSEFDSLSLPSLTTGVQRPAASAISYVAGQLRSDYSKEVGGQFIRIRLKIAKKCGLYLDIFSCVKMNIFCSFFAFMLEMHVRCDNQYKTGADREIFWDSRCCLCAWVSAF